MAKRTMIAGAGVLWLIASGTGRTHTALAQSRRVLQPDDIFELKTVGDPRISPDGTWVAFTMTTLDRNEDTSDTDIYMVTVSALRPFDTLGVAPSSVEGRQAQGGPEPGRGAGGSPVRLTPAKSASNRLAGVRTADTWRSPPLATARRIRRNSRSRTTGTTTARPCGRPTAA